MTSAKTRIPEDAKLPIVVTPEWLAAVNAASWWCQCQRLYDATGPRCTHVHQCEHPGFGPGAYGLVLDADGTVLCVPCATKRANTRARQARLNSDALAASTTPSLFDLIEGDA